MADLIIQRLNEILPGLFLLILFFSILLNLSGGSQNPSKNNQRKRRRNTYPASQKQINYLNFLIDRNNNYRAHPMTLADWDERIPLLLSDSKQASYLIKRLLDENTGMRAKAKKIVNERLPLPPDSLLNVSDLAVFKFCPKAFEFSRQGFASFNFYDLDRGSQFHEKFERNFSKSVDLNKVSRAQFTFLPPELSNRRLEWCESGSEVFVDARKSLKGIPDAFLIDASGKKSVVEFKTTTRDLNSVSPYKGHILQAVGYRYLIDNKLENLDNDIWICYSNVQTKSVKAFHFNYPDHLGELRKTIVEMNAICAGDRVSDYANSKDKCFSCGFRSICK